MGELVHNVVAWCLIYREPPKYCPLVLTNIYRLPRQTLGFRWLSFSADSMITPPPGEVQEVCAAVMCNVKNLNFYHT